LFCFFYVQRSTKFSCGTVLHSQEVHFVTIEEEIIRTRRHELC
jgi:hypothetical protein